MNTLVICNRRAALAFVLALSFLAAFPALAQNTSPNHPEPDFTPPILSYGIRAGLSQTDFYGESTGTSDPGAGITAGAFLNYRLNSTLSLQPEVLYAHRTGKVDHSTVYPGSQPAEYTFDFLEIPLLIKGYLPVQNGPMPYLVLGPYARMRLSEKVKDQNYVLDKVNLDNELRTWDYGLTAGLGLENLAGRRSLFFDARYSLGLPNLFTDSNRPDFHTRGFTFTFGLGL